MLNRFKDFVSRMFCKGKRNKGDSVPFFQKWTRNLSLSLYQARDSLSTPTLRKRIFSSMGFREKGSTGGRSESGTSEIIVRVPAVYAIDIFPTHFHAFDSTRQLRLLPQLSYLGKNSLMMQKWVFPFCTKETRMELYFDSIKSKCFFFGI